MQSEEFVTSLLLYADTFSCASEGTLLCSVQPTHVAPEHAWLGHIVYILGFEIQVGEVFTTLLGLDLGKVFGWD